MWRWFERRYWFGDSTKLKVIRAPFFNLNPFLRVHFFKATKSLSRDDKGPFWPFLCLWHYKIRSYRGKQIPGFWQKQLRKTSPENSKNHGVFPCFVLGKTVKAGFSWSFWEPQAVCLEDWTTATARELCAAEELRIPGYVFEGLRSQREWELLRTAEKVGSGG